MFCRWQALCELLLASSYLHLINFCIAGHLQGSWAQGPGRHRHEARVQWPQRQCGQAEAPRGHGGGQWHCATHRGCAIIPASGYQRPLWQVRELYCVAWVSCEARARVTSPRFDSYQMMKATLRADKKNMLIERILLCPGHTLLHWAVNCFLLIFFVHIFDNIFTNSEIRRVRSNRRPPPWTGGQWDFHRYQWYYS